MLIIKNNHVYITTFESTISTLLIILLFCIINSLHVLANYNNSYVCLYLITSMLFVLTGHCELDWVKQN